MIFQKTQTTLNNSIFLKILNNNKKTILFVEIAYRKNSNFHMFISKFIVKNLKKRIKI